MTPEWALASITLIGLVGTALNVWITFRIHTDIAKMKVWTLEKFVAKQDMENYLAPYSMLREALQLRESVTRSARNG